MKLALIRLKKNNIASVHSSANGIDTASMGIGLILTGATRMAKEHGITEQEAMDMILETMEENKDKITRVYGSDMM